MSSKQVLFNENNQDDVSINLFCFINKLHKIIPFVYNLQNSSICSTISESIFDFYEYGSISSDEDIDKVKTFLSCNNIYYYKKS